jgi:hypothetical protein
MLATFDRERLRPAFIHPLVPFRLLQSLCATCRFSQT